MDLMYKEKLIGVYKKDSIEITNKTVEMIPYFKTATKIKGTELIAFITDRIISQSRRDIDKFLFKIGLRSYDIYEIAVTTRLINPMDGFWLRESAEETYGNFVIPKLIELFEDNKITQKNTMSSGGQNIKYYSKHGDSFGIVKKRLAGVTYDTEAEIAVYNLSRFLNIKTCPVYRIDEDHTFSAFQYNFLTSNIIHMRHALNDYNDTEDTYTQIVRTFPDIKDDLIRMLILDYVTAQDDRHMSNYALCGDSLYPLYDNGRSLFWEDRVENISINLTDIKLYSKTFGEIGTYYTILEDLSKKGIIFSELANLDIAEEDIYSIYREAGFDGERLELITQWTYFCLEELLRLDRTNKNKIYRSSIKTSSLFNTKNED